MKDYSVKSGFPVFLKNDDELEITSYILEIIQKDKLCVLAYNICGDHVHIVLECFKKELPGIVQKLKSVSSRRFNTMFYL